jgi:N-dimethylarginine dimethylaminohydrolase
MSRTKLLIGLGAMVMAMPVVAASVVYVMNNMNTSAEARCDRFWMSKAASKSCHDEIFEAQTRQYEEDMARSNADIELRGREIERQRQALGL